MINGYKIIEDESCLQTVDNPDYSWVDVVLNWNPCNNLSRHRLVSIPSTQIYYAGEYMIAHPDTIRTLKQRIAETENNNV